MAVRKAVIYREIAMAIHHGNLWDGKIYKVVEPEPGKKQVLEEIENRVVCYVDINAVVNSILLFSINTGAFEDLTHRDAIEAAKYWLGIQPPIKMPHYLGQKYDQDLCFHRLSFNHYDEPGQTLVIDDFMSRCTNKDALMQFIGSLLVEDSSRFQYGWIYGSGGEGKGSFARGLVDIFGPGCVTMPVPKTDGQKQFLAHSLQGKRLCVFPECSNYNFPRDPLFKQLTGGDHVWLEQKGKMGFSAPISCKFLFLSNDRPGVDGSDANMRRMIYSEVSKPTVTYSPGIYDALIRAEMPSFILKCRNLYLDKCPNNEVIKIDANASDNLIESNEEQYEDLTNKWFIKDINGYVTPARLREILRLEKLSNHEYRLWLEYMRSKIGIESKSQKWDRAICATRRWVGIRDRTTEEYASWVLDKGGYIGTT